MIRIIETRAEAAPEALVYEFKVYPGQSNPLDVFGYVLPSDHAARHAATDVAASDFGVPAAEAFLHALSLCERNNVPVLWVHDSFALFPPDKRPVRQLP